jgi:3-hydroxybutyryl-CoA dehydrogenase
MKVGVLGTGTMGAGIIQVFAQSGYEVYFRARRQSSVDGGLSKVTKNLERLVSKEKITQKAKDETVKRIHGSIDLTILKDVDLIVESATENMEEKKALFAELAAVCRDDVIFATNTSSLSITELAASTKHPDKVIGMHFFNPAPVMKLVEIVSGLTTSDTTRNTVYELAVKLGKSPIDVSDGPGFVVNRMLIPLINEAVDILHDGVASREDIDTAMKLGANHPMGPLALGDLIGLDVVLAILEVMYTETLNSKYRPHTLLKKMVRAGYLGQKTGKGFYDYPEK